MNLVDGAVLALIVVAVAAVAVPVHGVWGLSC